MGKLQKDCIEEGQPDRAYKSIKAGQAADKSDNLFNINKSINDMTK